MKRFLGILMSAVLVFSLAACGSEVVEEPPVEPSYEEPVASVEPAAEEPSAEEPALAEEPAEENGETYDFILEYESIKAYYGNYLSDGLSDEGYFVSPESGMTIYNPMLAMLDLNGDNYDDLIVAGELGLRSKGIAEIYYFNDGCFCTSDIGGTPYGVTEGGFLVHDPDNDTESMTIYEDDYVYMLGFDEAVELLACLTTTTYDQEGNEVVEQTYRVDREEADEQEYFLYYTPYVESYDDISYEELTLENIQAHFAMG